MWRRFFFFQAEDGIRDLTVTGVQTCALPISGRPPDRGGVHPPPAAARGGGRDPLRRSEERRVGKECRSGWSPYEEKENSDGTEECLTSSKGAIGLPKFTSVRPRPATSHDAPH